MKTDTKIEESLLCKCGCGGMASGWQAPQPGAGVNGEGETKTHGELEADIREIRLAVRALNNMLAEVRSSKYETRPGADKGEIAANMALAYRHIEDGVTRLGKALHYAVLSGHNHDL